MEGLWQVIQCLLVAAWELPCSCHRRELQGVPLRSPVTNMSEKAPSGVGTLWTLVPVKIGQAEAARLGLYGNKAALPAREAPFI